MTLKLFISYINSMKRKKKIFIYEFKSFRTLNWHVESTLLV